MFKAKKDLNHVLQDLYAKCEGSLNVQNVVKAFVLGLLRQRTHQALADEKQLHLVGIRWFRNFLSVHSKRKSGLLQVEMRKESDYYPTVIASPSDGKARFLSKITSHKRCVGSDPRGDRSQRNSRF